MEYLIEFENTEIQAKYRILRDGTVIRLIPGADEAYCCAHFESPSITDWFKNICNSVIKENNIDTSSFHLENSLYAAIGFRQSVYIPNKQHPVELY